MKKSIRDDQIPAETKTEMPNQTTLDAIREAEEDIRNPNIKTYDSFDDLLKDLDK